MLRALGVGAFCLVGVQACAPQPTRMIDARADPTGYGMGLDRRDFTAAAQELTEQLLDSGKLDRPDGRKYVLSVGRLRNETMQHFDAEIVTNKILKTLEASNKVDVTKVSMDGRDGDPLTLKISELRKSREFSHENLSQPGEQVAPNLSLTGKFIQMNTTVDDGQRVDYYFQLTLTDLRTGLALWEDEHPISKLGTARTVAW